MENKENTCKCENGKCVCSGDSCNWKCWGYKSLCRHFILRWILGIFILSIVFCLGVKVGEFKGEFGGMYGQYGHHHNIRGGYYGQMMENPYYQNGYMMQYGSPVRQGWMSPGQSQPSSTTEGTTTVPAQK